MKETYNFEEGEMITINKPKGWTSFDVVNKLRYALKIKKIGHAGTLDPLATGLLIICTGKLTKTLETFQNLPKIYTGKIILGKTSPSHDAETPISEPKPTNHLNEKIIQEHITKFIGEIEQIPPQYSAIRVNGERAYKKARNNEQITLKPRKITVSEFYITHLQIPEIEFKIHCSKGTYIRSIARDIGENLQVGAYLSELSRTAIGNYSLTDAFEINNFIEKITQNGNHREHIYNNPTKTNNPHRRNL
ncbi:MAG: tRNA pseudouridine(55) synthase TruB [Chitinophagaceae bacterium]|nr:tRNA pseudouridine(55) synthase TruB [Chitinophagaceae bacterium]